MDTRKLHDQQQGLYLDRSHSIIITGYYTPFVATSHAQCTLWYKLYKLIGLALDELDQKIKQLMPSICRWQHITFYSIIEQRCTKNDKFRLVT